MYKLGVDLGGTKTEAVLLDENFSVIKRKRIPTPQNDYQTLKTRLRTLEKKISNSPSGMN